MDRLKTKATPEGTRTYTYDAVHSGLSTDIEWAEVAATGTVLLAAAIYEADTHALGHLIEKILKTVAGELKCQGAFIRCTEKYPAPYQPGRGRQRPRPGYPSVPCADCLQECILNVIDGSEDPWPEIKCPIQ